ncbi:MAG: vWA domain-containing protein [Planctomycetota bacterium]|jgi:hypothetical protein
MRRGVVLLVVCGLVAADWEEAHRRFQEAYRADAGAEQRKAALLEVAGADVREAAALLFDVWEELDREAIRRRKELWKLRSRMHDERRKLRRARDAKRRQELHAALDALNDADVALNVKLARIEIEQGAVLEGLASMKSPAVLDWLAQTGLDRAAAPLLRRAVALRLAAVHESGVDTLLVALDGTKRSDTLIPLLQALARHGARIGRPALPSILKHLNHADWAVRVAAAHAVARAAQPEGVGALVRALGRERQRSRAQREIARALTVLTGRKLGSEPEPWARWWRDHETEVMAGKVVLGQGKPTQPKADQGRFYGIPQVAERNIYILDKSGSMEVSMEDPRWQDGHAVSAKDDEDSRFDAALRELRRATKALRADVRYAVILYADHATALHEGLVPATLQNHAALDRELDHHGAAGSTNIYEALDLALRMANVHPESPRGPAQADAIFLISDGSPTDARGRPEDPERTLQAVRMWNAHQRVAIHAVGIGRQHNEAFLRRLAADHGGTYLAVMPKRAKRK